MKVTCDKCGKSFNRKPSKVKERNYCSPECFKTTETRPCEQCGKEVSRCQSQMREHVFCNLECSRKWLSERMSGMNVELNPDRMTEPTRTKLRESRLGTGEGKSYEKTFGRHTHRLAAERILGRKLGENEVVHHVDEDKRNNHPLNLMIFNSQKEHAKWHQNEKHNPSANYE